MAFCFDIFELKLQCEVNFKKILIIVLEAKLHVWSRQKISCFNYMKYGKCFINIFKLWHFDCRCRSIYWQLRLRKIWYHNLCLYGKMCWFEGCANVLQSCLIPHLLNTFAKYQNIVYHVLFDKDIYIENKDMLKILVVSFQLIAFRNQEALLTIKVQRNCKLNLVSILINFQTPPRSSMIKIAGRLLMLSHMDMN